MEDRDNEVLRVSSSSDPRSVAGAIMSRFDIENSVKLSAIGAGAVNQTIKAVAVARGFAAPRGINLVIIPSFATVMINAEERTIINFSIEGK